MKVPKRTEMRCLRETVQRLTDENRELAAERDALRARLDALEGRRGVHMDPEETAWQWLEMQQLGSVVKEAANFDEEESE